MTIDVNSQEFKDAVQAAVDAATEGLAAKNRELLGEVKKLKRGAEIDPAEVAALESQIDTLKADLTKAQKEAKAFSKQAEDNAKALESEAGFTRTLLIEQGLTAELVSAGVNDKRVAKIGDKAQKDFVKEWSTGDDGKHFVTADQNAGGGASGGGGGGAVAKTTMARAAFDAMTPQQKATASLKGVTLTD